MDSAQALSKTDSFQYPAAHFGHLTEGQQAALDSFKELCLENGYYRPAEHGNHASHDDETLLRYLRARRFNPKEGFRQFKETEDWRKDNRIVEYYDKIDIHEYEIARKLYPQWTGGRDRRGIPVYVFQVAPLDSKTITVYQTSLKNDKSPALNLKGSVPPRMLRLHALYENLTRFVLPLCSAVKANRPHPETPISQSNNIVDISGVGLRQFWNLKNHMQDASTVATALYPETLDRIFIIGAPSFFPTVWSWIKRWFDPITVSKIFILSQQDMKETLEKYIAPENIPRQYGGTLDYEFGMLPVLEPAIRDMFVSKAQAAELPIPIGPIKWKENENGGLDLVAVGSENGSQRNVTVGKIRADFGFIHGISRQNTQIDWAHESMLSTTGTATQPAVDGDPEYGKELLNSGSGTQTPVNSGTKESGSRTVPIVAGGTSTGMPPSQDQPEAGASATARQVQGTTSTEAVDAKSAQRIVDSEQGNEAAVTEPSTLGAAEEHHVPDAAGPASSYVEQARNVVASAAGTAVDQVLVGTGLKAEHEDLEGAELGSKDDGAKKGDAKPLSEKGTAEVEQHLGAQQAAASS